MKNLEQLWDEVIRDYAFYLDNGNAILAETYERRSNMIFKAQFEINEALIKAGRK